MSNLRDSQTLLDAQENIERSMVRLQKWPDPMEIVLRHTEGKAKLQVQRFTLTDLGVRVVISLIINWEIGEGEDEDDYFVGEWLEYARDTVDLWSATERERFIRYCRSRLKQVSSLTWCWGPITNPMEIDWVLWGIEDQILMSIS